MIRLLLPAWAALLTLSAFADDTIQWGQPVNGLRIGIESKVTTITSAQDPTFAITAQNVSSQPITLPTPGTFLLKSGRNDDFHVTPLSPVITRDPLPLQTGAVAMATSSPIGPTVESLQPHIVAIGPGQSVTWNDVPLGRSYYSPFLQFNHRTEVEKSVLYPDSVYHIKFRYENDQTPVGNTAAWTGQADSGEIDLHVNAPSLDGIKIEGRFTLPQSTYFLGDPIEATFTVTNRGDKPIYFPTGGDYRATGRHERFSIHAVDSRGWSVSDPMWWKRFFPAMGGGLGGMARVNLDESYQEKVPINQWCAFSRAGKYKITCKRTLNVSIYDDNDPNRMAIYSKPESSLPAVPIETTLEVTLVDKPSSWWTYFSNLYSWLRGHGKNSQASAASPHPPPPAPNPKVSKQEMEAGRQLFQKVLKAMQARDAATALPLAQEILQHDPLERGPYQMGTGIRKVALSALNVFGKMEPYLDDLNRRLAADPNSLRLNLLAAEAYGSMNGTAGKVVHLPTFATPAWLRLARKDDTFTASYSSDGQNWNDVFTKTVPMNADALVGLIASPNSAAIGDVAWENIEVNGKSMASEGMPDNPSPTALPAPWQYGDIGWAWFHAGAQWNGATLKMISPVSKAPQPFFFQTIGYVYQPLSGDGEIVARLMSLTPQVNDGNWAGLCFRTRLDDTCPFVEFYCDHLHRARYSGHTDAVDTSVRFYKRAAELASNDAAALRMISMQLQGGRKPGDANVIMASSYLADFPKDGIHVMDALPVFENAGQLSKFVKVVEDWNPYDSSMCATLIRIGDELQLTGHPDEAERIYRKTLSMSVGPTSKQDTVTSLVRLLTGARRQEDAVVEFKKGFMGRDSSSWMPWLPHPPDLIYMTDAWYKISDMKRFAEIDDQTVPLLEMAASLGLYSELKQQLDARADSGALTSLNPVDPSRLASLLLSIIARDPGYRPGLDKLTGDIAHEPPPENDSPSGNPNAMAAAGVNFDALMLVCEQLAQWPGERPEALRLAQFDFHGHLDGTTDNSSFRTKAEYQVLRAAVDSGDHATARQILSDLIGSVPKYRAQAFGRWPVDRAPVVRMMIQEGMFQEAAGLLADAQSDPQVMNDPAYRQKMDRIGTELAFAQGQAPPDGLICGLTAKPGGAAPVFFWQINAGEKGNDTYPAEVAAHPDHAHAFMSDVLWSETVPARPTGCRVEVQAGPDEGHLTRLTTFDHVATIGNAPLEVPPGTHVLKASLFPENSAATSVNAPPLDAGSPLLLGDPANLLNNPGFEVSKNAQGIPEISGWHGLLPVNVTQASGGPMPSGVYQIVEVPDYRADMGAFEVGSDAIPLKPGTDYVLSAWQHDGMAPRFLFLDAKGTELRSPRSASCERHDGWQRCAWRLNHAFSGETNDISIPPGAVSVQILFAHTLKVANLSFRALSGPATGK